MIEEEKSEINEKQVEEPKDSLNIKELYQRIDQEELERIGVGDKAELTQKAIAEVHEYSML